MASLNDLLAGAQAGTNKKSTDAKLSGMGMGVSKSKKSKPGIISRTFDILSRPLYSIAEGTARAAEHLGAATPEERKKTNALTDIFSGFYRGATGENKTSFMDVLDRSAKADPNSIASNAIQTNKLNAKTILGLTGDIGFDPVTHGRANAIKGVSEAERIAKAAQESAKVAEEGAYAVYEVGKKAHEEALLSGKLRADVDTASEVLKNKKVIRESVEKGNIGATRKAMRERVAQFKLDRGRAPSSKEYDNLKKGVVTRTLKAAKKEEKVAKGALKEVSKKLSESASEASNLAEATEAKIWQDKALKAGQVLDSAPGKVEFSFLGKKVGESEKIYKGVSNIGKGLKMIPGAKELHQLASPAAKFAGDTHQLYRKTVLEGATKVTRFRNLLDETLAVGKLTDKELTDILHATEAGQVLGGEAGKVQEAMKTWNKDLFQEMQDYGLVDWADDFGENYVPHYYNTFDANAAVEAHKTRNARSAAKALSNTEPMTLERAAAEGLNPNTNFREVMMRKVAEVEQAKINRSFFNAVGNELGVSASEIGNPAFKNLGLKKVVSSHFEEGEKWFPETVAQTLQFVKDAHKMGPMHPEIKALERLFGKTTGFAKRWQLGYNPGAQIRNAAGDLIMGWQDGVKNPKVYDDAFRIIRNETKPEAFSSLRTDAGYLQGTVESGGKGVKVGTIDIPDTKLLRLYEQSGARSGMITHEVQGGKNFVARKVYNFSEGREDWTRLGHFIHAMKEEGQHIGAHMSHVEMEKALEVAADKSARRVRKWHIDYGDKSAFESRFVSKAIPYYTFMKKNIPLQIEGLFMRPGKVATLAKNERALQQLIGGTDSNDLKPWLKEFSAVRIQGEGEGKNAIYWMNPNPVKEALSMFEGTGSDITGNFVSMASPVGLLPFEMATGHKAFNKMPTKSLPQELLNLLPLGRTGQQALPGGESSETVHGVPIKLWNFLAGTKFQENKGT